MRILEKPTVNRSGLSEATISIKVPLSDAESAERAVENVKEGDYTLQLKKMRQRRSLSANAYAWVLIGDIAEAQGLSAIEVYRQEVANMQTYYVVEVAEKACNRFMSDWRSNGLGWLAEIISKSDKEGFLEVRCTYGSSAYTQREMSTFIDLIIADCEALGIETESPEWIQRKVSLWGIKMSTRG